jgi:hypothetical protein
MGYLLGSTQVLAGVGSIVLWWLTVHLVERRNAGKPLTNLGFSVVPAFFLTWFVAGCVLILRGLGAV